MASFNHLRAIYSAEVGISADAFFDAAADWSGLLPHLHPNHPFKFTHISLAEGSNAGSLPCTRLMHLDKAQLPAGSDPDAMPDYFQETLLAADKEAGTLVYRVEGDTMGMRNYYAVKEIESLEGDRARVTISARFDFPAAGDSRAIVEALIVVYKGVIHGIDESLQIA